MPPYTVRWGILATGEIAGQFTRDLLIDPESRDTTDIQHEVVAAASSNSVDRAVDFLKRTGCPPSAKGYGSYHDLVSDGRVDIVYVATPHSHHFQNAMMCLQAGKHVLCEKALTVNAAQAKVLSETARRNNLFLMEAMWTRYFPLSVQIRDLIKEGRIGPVRRVLADFSVASDVEAEFGTEHRLVNLDLAGGTLLDIGVYSLAWLFQTLYHTLPPSERKPPTVLSMISKYPKTGVDETATILLNFPVGPCGADYAHGVAMCGFRTDSDPDGHCSAGPAIRIQGTQGEIQVDPPACQPTVYRIIDNGGESEPSVSDFECEIPAGGTGLFWEADEAARCLRDGRTESEGLPWEESILIMEVMDEVRGQAGLRYPDRIESTEYPLDL